MGVLVLHFGFYAPVAFGQPLAKTRSERAAVPQAIVSPVVLRFPTVEAGLLRFSRLTPTEGLSHTRVAHIIQGPLGYMWLGTQYGLDRYDGYTFKTFVHDPRRRGSLGGAFVTALFKAQDGTIWVATSQVLDRYDPLNQTFTHYRIGDAQSGDAMVVGVSEDRTGYLWLSTGRGLYRMNPRTGRLKHFHHEPANPYSLSTNDIDWTGEDRSGEFWVGTAEGLDRFDRKTGRVLLHIPIADPVGLSAFEDSHGRFWIIHASGDGLALFDRRSNTVYPVSFYARDPPANALTGVMGVLEDRHGQLWFGSPGGGILKFDRKNRRFLRYRLRAGTTGTPVDAEDEVISLARDRDGEIWAGLHSMGVVHFSPRPSPFHVYRHEPDDPQSLDINFVNAIYEDNSSHLWIGNDLGLNRIDERSGHRELLAFGLGAKPMVISVLGDGHGRIWFGTFANGLGRYDPVTAKVRFYKHDPHDPTSLSNDEVHRIFIDRLGTLWVATDDGLDRFDSASGHFRTYEVDQHSRHSQSYLAIAQDKDGALWLGTQYSGLQRLDIKTGRITVFHPVPGDLNSLRGESVPSVLAARSGLIWVGTLGGLNSIDPKSDTFRAYDVTNGLASNFVSCILEDAAGVLWMSTNRGISRFDPASRSSVSYSTADGLPGNDLTGWGSCYRSAQGELFFTGYPGAVGFYARSLAEHPVAPEITITGFELFGRSVPIGADSPLKRAIDYARHITLSHEQSIFSLRFAALSYRSPGTIRYRYRLEPLERNWNEVGSARRQATYTTLPPGAYRFYVQAAARDGPWSEPGASLQIRILPPWWDTRPFQAAVATLLILIAWATYRQRVAQIARQFEAGLAERTRIARELHDTLLQTLHGLLFQFQAVRNLLPRRPVEALKSLDESINDTERALSESRDAIQGLRSEPLAGRIEEVLVKASRDLARAGPVEQRPPIFELIEEGEIHAISPAIKSEILRIALEILRNAYRHAKASRIEAEIRYDDQVLRIRIRDDGSGIDSKVLKEGGVAGHWGLRGARERALRIGAELEFWSEIDTGTEVQLTVPGDIAYEDLRAVGKFGLIWKVKNRAKRS